MIYYEDIDIEDEEAAETEEEERKVQALLQEEPFHDY